ncbi:MAG: hypothetical protein DKINENOH_04569 [bacterium]|nr:hypothetical protein [bacterium]
MPGENNDKQKPAGGSRGGQENHDWASILSEAKSGDSAALDKLCGFVRECAHEFVRRDRMPSRVTAEDFAQEVATAFLKQVHNIRHLPAWLGVVCSRLRAGYLRKRYRETADSLEAMIEIPGKDVPASLQSEPETSRIEARLEVELLLQRLKPNQRLVLAMRLLDGMEYDEIARQLNKSVDTVRLLYFRAKKNLVSLMNPKHGEDRHHGLDAHRAQKR